MLHQVTATSTVLCRTYVMGHHMPVSASECPPFTDMNFDMCWCCSYPTQTYGPEYAFLYGECIFSSYTAADLDLADELQAAAEAAAFPAR